MQGLNNPFGAEAKPYRYVFPETPYSKNTQDYDFPIGEYVKKAAFWRSIFAFTILVNLLLSIFLVFMVSSNPVHILAGYITDKGFLVQKGALNNNLSDSSLELFFLNSVFNNVVKNNKNNTYSEKVQNKISKVLNDDNEYKLTDFNFNKNTRKFNTKLIFKNNNLKYTLSGTIYKLNITRRNNILKNPLEMYVSDIKIER